jgi:hypothetical protein
MELIAGDYKLGFLCSSGLVHPWAAFYSIRGVPANYPAAPYKCGVLITQWGGGSPCRAVRTHVVDSGVIITPHPVLSVLFGGVYPRRTHTPISALHPIYRVWGAVDSVKDIGVVLD